jgi:hypothetical protein
MEQKCECGRLFEAAEDYIGFCPICEEEEKRIARCEDAFDERMGEVVD